MGDRVSSVSFQYVNAALVRGLYFTRKELAPTSCYREDNRRFLPPGVPGAGPTRYLGLHTQTQWQREGVQ